MVMMIDIQVRQKSPVMKKSLINEATHEKSTHYFLQEECILLPTERQENKKNMRQDSLQNTNKSEEF